MTLSCVNTSIRTVIAAGLDGSYDLIYSAGLFDYLTDRHVRTRPATRLAAALTPGGRAVIGNFGAANPTRPLMELFLDWPLYHRSASDLRLFGDSGTSMTVEQEATGINLFAVLTA